MLETQPKRLGLLMMIFGIVTLGISLYMWAQSSAWKRLYYVRHQYDWVRAESSEVSAIQTDEVWNASAACIKPYLIKLRDRTKSASNIFAAEVHADPLGRNFNPERIIQGALLARRAIELEASIRLLRDQRLLASESEISDVRLGLDKFSRPEALLIFKQCVDITPIKKILTKTTYHTNIDWWPYDHPIPFWIGIAMIILGGGFNPLVKWIRAAK